MRSPKISVILPVYNGEKFVKQSIKSIFNQTFKNFELIVINDGSIDKTVQILNKIQDKRLRVFKNIKNLGVAKSLNIGLKHARGEYIARCDSDDINNKERFNAQVNFLDNHHGYVLVGSNTEEINEKGTIIAFKKYPERDIDIKRGILIRNQISHPTVMVRRNVLKKINGYREVFNGVEDYDLWFRLMETGKFYNLQENLIQRRIHPEVVTVKNHFKIELLALIIRLINLSQFI